MLIDIDEIVRQIDVKKLVENGIQSNILQRIDTDGLIDDALEEKELQKFVNRRVIEIIDVFLSSEEGKNCTIEKFKEEISDYDILSDDRVTDRVTNMIIELLKTSLIEK